LAALVVAIILEAGRKGISTTPTCCLNSQTAKMLLDVASSHIRLMLWEKGAFAGDEAGNCVGKAAGGS
jgi:hypothetical protein